MTRVLVVGGGIAGLAAAVALVDAGSDVELWEAGPRLGGKIATSPFAVGASLTGVTVMLTVATALLRLPSLAR